MGNYWIDKEKEIIDKLVEKSSDEIAEFLELEGDLTTISSSICQFYRTLIQAKQHGGLSFIVEEYVTHSNNINENNESNTETNVLR